MEFDSQGNFGGLMTTITSSGAVVQNYGGTYSVSSEGTGTFQWTRSSTGEFLRSNIIGLEHNGSIFVKLYSGFNEPEKSRILQGRLIYRAPQHTQYNNKSLHGTFWIGKEGGSPLTDVEGLMSFDGQGNFFGKYNYQNDNGSVTTTNFSGTYSVNSDGQAKFHWNNNGESRVVPTRAVGTEIMAACSANTYPISQDGSIQVYWLHKRDDVFEDFSEDVLYNAVIPKTARKVTFSVNLQNSKKTSNSSMDSGSSSTNSTSSSTPFMLGISPVMIVLFVVVCFLLVSLIIIFIIRLFRRREDYNAL